MATKTAIAAKDRRVKEAEIKEKKRQFDKSYAYTQEMKPYEKMKGAATVTKDLFQAAYGKGGLAGAMGKSNDPAWYKKFNLNKFSTNLPTFYRLGSEVQYQWLNESYNDKVPGIATLVYCPTLPNQLQTNVYGAKHYQVSSINQSLTRFMAELRKLNSRIGDYDPSDIGLYWYSVIGLIIKMGELMKAIKGYNTYYAENEYLSRSFIKSCGFDPDDFFVNVQNYKAALMRWTDLFNANAVIPDSLDLLKRYAWLSTVVVREHKDNNSQLYHFRCSFDMHLTDDEEYVAFNRISGLHTFLVFKTNVDNQILQLFNSAGVVTMTADLRAAFPDNKLLKWPCINGSEMLDYSESIHDLEQIHNARTLPIYASKYSESTYNPNVLQRAHIVVDSDGYLAQGQFDSSNNLLPIVYDGGLTNPQLVPMSVYAGENKQFLNFYDTEMVSDDSILESTRFRYTLMSYLTAFSGHAFREIGTEIITHIELTAGRTDAIDSDIINIYTDWLTNGYGLDSTELFVCALYSTFDWAPWIRYIYTDDSTLINTVGEIDHAIALSNQNLRIIHEGCAFSLFYVDTFSKGLVA